MHPSATTFSLQETIQGGFLLAALLALLLMIPIQSHAQQGLPPQGNPHGDLSDPMLPPPDPNLSLIHISEPTRPY